MYKLILFFLFNTLIFASGWKQTSGPEGANFRSIAIKNNDIFASTYYGHVFHYNGTDWQKMGKTDNSAKLEYFDVALFSASSLGLRRSDDNGASWSDFIVTGNCSLIFTKNNKLYVAASDTLYSSVDGINWNNPLVSTTANTMLFGEPTLQELINFEAVAITDSTYAIGTTTSVYPIPKGVYVTSDNGENWSIAEGLPDPTQMKSMVEYNDVIVANSYNDMYRSLDGGFSWVPFNTGLPVGNFSTINTGEIFKDNNKLYVFSLADNKYYELIDTTWIPMFEVESGYGSILKNGKIYVYGSNGIEVIDVASGSGNFINAGIIATSPVPAALTEDVVYAKSNYSTFVTSDAGATWMEDSLNYSKHVYSDGNIFAVSDEGLMKSSDMGETWFSSSAGIQSSYKEAVNNLFADPVTGFLYAALNKTRPRTHLSPVWLAGGIYRSTNNGESWQKISNGLPSQGGISVPVYNLHVHGELLVTRTLEGIYASVNGGANWQPFEDGLTYTFVSDFAGTGSRMFGLSYNEVYYFDTNTSEWTNDSEGLPEPDYTFELFHRFLVVKDELMLYRRVDGQNYLYSYNNGLWEETENDMPDDVRFNYFSVAGAKIFAGAQENGMWVKDLSITDVNNNVLSATEFSIEQNYPNPFNPETNIKFNLPDAGNVTIKVHNSLGEVVSENSDYFSAGTHISRFNGASLASGVYFYTISLNTQGNKTFNSTRKMILLK